MERIDVRPGEALHAAVAGEQLFRGSGPGSLVCLNGNPADYSLRQLPASNGEDLDRYTLTALNGSGTYGFDATIERIGFVSGAYTLVRNLPAVIAAGDRHATRLVNTRPFASYAQVREDVLLMRALRDVPADTGFYIDVGAYDPDEDSVTRIFYEMGWRGINVEPSPAHVERLDLRRPRDVNICAAASSKSGRMRFFQNDGEQLGTLEERFAHPSAAATLVEVPVVRLDEVCREHGVRDIHFLKVDVEGHERSVLEGCDFTAYRPWIVIVEAVVPNAAGIATFGE